MVNKSVTRLIVLSPHSNLSETSYWDKASVGRKRHWLVSPNRKEGAGPKRVGWRQTSLNISLTFIRGGDSHETCMVVGDPLVRGFDGSRRRESYPCGCARL